jgi:NAD(P)-dependent dehydrogenase (short-subunit alcohol dehydrogenase family)
MRVPGAEVELLQLDLGDLVAVERAADALFAMTDGIDILVANAGVMAPPVHLTTAQGFELQLGTNHLGHFALIGRVLDLLLARPDARVVTVSSLAHRSASLDFDDLQCVANYQPWRAYGASKLANILYFRELDRRSRAAGRQLTSVGAHPGLTRTHLASSGPRLAEGGRSKTSAASVALAVGARLFGQSPARGALPSLYAAAAPGLHGGEYIGPSGPGEARGAPVRRLASPAGQDDGAARRLWEISAELTGVDYAALGAR